jgi:hypothetical protein
MSDKFILKRDTHRSYEDLLKKPEWLEFSQRIKASRGNKCEWCESKKDIQVHHLGYREGIKPWDYEDHEVMVMCEPCHSELHDFADKLWNEVLKCRNMWIIHECVKAVRSTIERHTP